MGSVWTVRSQIHLKYNFLTVTDVLQFEIVTPDGQVRTANQYQNTDLFWALRGGGGGFGVSLYLLKSCCSNNTQVVTQVTYRTYPAITAISAILLSMNYTQPSYRNLLKTFYSLQPTLSAHNASGYTYPSPTSFSAQLVVHNSADLSGFNSTLAPLYAFAANETAQGRPVTVSSQAYVLPNYMSLFPSSPGSVNEGAGNNGILGSRLLPMSIWQGSSLDSIVDFITQTQFGVQIHLSEFISISHHVFFNILHPVAGGKVSEVAADATAIHPSWRRTTHHFILIGGWPANTTFEYRNVIRQTLTNATQALGMLVPDSGCYINEYVLLQFLSSLPFFLLFSQRF
jgi:hypothetical protein